MAALAMAQESAHYNWVFGGGFSTASLAGCERQLRGQYEDLHIYAYSANCWPAGSSSDGSVPAENAFSNLYVIERQHLEGDVVPRDHLAWKNNVFKAIRLVNSIMDRQDPQTPPPALEQPQEQQQDEPGLSADGEQHRFDGQKPINPLLGRSECRFEAASDLSPEQGQVDYRLILGSSCSAEEVTLLLADFLPSNTQILPVRTEGSIVQATALPPTHPVVQKKQDLVHRQELQQVVDSIDVKQMEKDITWLTGEAQGSPFTTRVSTSPQSHQVAAWLRDRLEASGCDTVEFGYHSNQHGPNVVCTFRGTKYPDELVILGAHHDSRGSFFNQRAPGANDDGSGTGMLLAVARAVQQHGVTFERTVQIAAFSGEEQGLLGSAYYARQLRNKGAKVVTMLQGDMLAYQKPGEPIQTAFPLRHHTPELTELLVNVTQLYVPETKVGFTGACCSDHQSFFENGFPATAFFERNGPIADPKYHNSADLVYRPGYSFEELKANTKAMMASIFELANFKLKPAVVGAEV
ncbi:hypothetical protein BGZ73_009193 [Actinomortierella ambigua]|nr:hypothetical protein BGZ73_009193 [Actinomortierella ambigua]